MSHEIDDGYPTLLPASRLLPQEHLTIAFSTDASSCYNCHSCPQVQDVTNGNGVSQTEMAFDCTVRYIDQRSAEYPLP